MAGGEGASLEQTPTYAVAFTAFVFILISLLVERGIHQLKKYLKRRGQKPLRKVLDKLTDELMLLGFISLLLTVLQTSLVKVCVPTDFSEHMLPCSKENYAEEDHAPSPETTHVSNLSRRLLSLYATTKNSVKLIPRRRLAAEEVVGNSARCAAKGKVQFLSLDVLHDLHLFIFVLAVTHVCYCVATVLLGFARVRDWQKWESETREDGYDGNLELEKRYCEKMRCKKKPLIGLGGHANAFVNRHANHACYDHTITLWMLCFFQQFFASVSREDYLIFRVGFLNKHNLGESFNFRDYVIRSMEIDFKRVIGISWWLWLFAIAFLLLNAHGWYTYFWAAFIPTIIVIVIGTKQQHIISTLALQAKRHASSVLLTTAASARISSRKVIDISTAVSPSDNLFWFDNPTILLRLIHFVIFQNSFELAIFVWIATTEGVNSCILGSHPLLIVRLVVGILTQLLVSYSTLPIYALVTQMGSQLKDTVFTKEVFDGLQGWRMKAKRARERRSSEPSSAENSVKSQQNDTKNGGPNDETTARPPPAIELPAIPSERAVQEPVDQPDPELAKKCQKLYGKANGMEKLMSARRCSRRIG